MVEEVDANGGLVWQWRMSDHVDVTEAQTTPRLVKTPTNPSTAVDVYHCNSVEVGPTGDVMVSARHNNAVYFIDKASGVISWKLGGTPSNHDGAQILSIRNDPEGTISGQHDARFRPGGNVSLYDDHTAAGAAARGVEYAIDTNAGTATLVWQYAAPDGNPGSATGSFRRSADGNDNIVGWGNKLPGSGFTEVDAAGNVMLEVKFPNGDQEYRALKEPAAALDAGLLRRAVPAPAPPSWESLGGVLAAAPAASSWGSGRLDVFTTGTDNQVHHKWYRAGWTDWESLGGTVTDTPAAVSWGRGRIDVFARGTDNQLWHRWYRKGWSAWEPLGGVLASGPAVASWGPGRLDVFVRGTDNQLLAQVVPRWVE